MSEYADQQSRGDIRVESPWLTAASRALREHRLIFALVAVYAIGATALAWSTGSQEPASLLLQLLMRLKILVNCVLFYVVAVDVSGAIRAAPSAPLGELIGRLRARLSPDIVAPIAIILALVLFLSSFTTAKTMLTLYSGFAWDQRLADFDAWLHGGVDPWRWLHPLMGHHAVTRFVQFCYLPVWLALTAGAPLWAALTPRLEGRRGRFLMTYLLTWVLLGNLIAGAFMSAGPVYFGQVTGSFERFKPLIEYHAFSTGAANSSYDLQRWLWFLHSSGRAEVGTGISAFPSLHVAMATLFAILGSLIGRRAFAIALAFLVLILAASVHLGWHYAVDGYASIILTVGIWFALKPLDARERPKT